MPFQASEVLDNIGSKRKRGKTPSSCQVNGSEMVHLTTNPIVLPAFDVEGERFAKLSIDVPERLGAAEAFYLEIKDDLPKQSKAMSAYFTFDKKLAIFLDADAAEAACRKLGYRSGEFVIRTVLP